MGGFNPSCLTFIPDNLPVAGEVTPVWGSESICDLLQLEFVVTGVTECVWGAIFEVSFPEEVAFFAGFDTTDSFLETAEPGTQVSVITQPKGGGIIEIGLARTDSTQFTGVVPEDGDLLIRLFFLRNAASGEGPVSILDAMLTKVGTITLPDDCGTPTGELPSDILPAVPFSSGEFFIE